MKNRPILSLPKRLPLSPAEARNDELNHGLDDDIQPLPLGRHGAEPDSVELDSEEHRPGRDLARASGAAA